MADERSRVARGGSSERDDRPRPSASAWILLAPVYVYRKVISPLLPPTCRFYPSCSAYAVEALTVHGALRGGWLTVRRLLKCGPWHPGGIDPVPSRGAAGTTARDTQDSDTQDSGTGPPRHPDEE